jgi:abequosyltransferase
MSEFQKVLSIAIPTYNRSRDLDVQIKWAVESIGGAWDAVELLISDNSSSDDTAELCAKWKAELGDNIHVFRNEENIGLVRNCLLSIERATGKFVWLVGDDDPMSINAVARVVDIIVQHGSLGLIHINHRCVSSLDGSIITPKFYNVDTDINSPNNGSYHLSQLLKDNNTGGLMFITANVLNKNLALNFIKNNPPELEEVELLLVYPLLLNVGLAAQSGFYFIAECLIDCAYYASSWLDRVENVQYEAVPKTLFKLRKFGISVDILKTCLNFQFKPLHSLRDTIYILRKKPSYLKEDKFKNWTRRWLLKLSLNWQLNLKK